MTNGLNFLNDMEFEERLAGMGDRELQEFIARQTYDVCALAGSNERRINFLEKRSTRFISALGSLCAVVGGGIVALINYFVGG